MERYGLTRDSQGRARLECPYRGTRLLRHPLYTKGTAFTEEERFAFGLEGLLPHHASSIEEQERRVYENIVRKTDALEKYIGLAALQDRNEHLFYRLLVDHLEEFLPIVYTPTVGRACQQWSHIFRRARGLWITPGHRGRIARGPGQRALRGRAPHRGHRQRAHPGSGRPGRRRHGHPHRQAGPLHRGRGDPSLADPARQPRRGHRQRGPAGRRSLPGLARPAPARRRIRRARGRVRARRQGAVPQGAPAVGGLQEGQRLPPARPLPAQSPQLQRRHPGHGGGGGGGDPGRCARHRRAARGAARGDPGRRARRASASPGCCAGPWRRAGLHGRGARPPPPPTSTPTGSWWTTSPSPTSTSAPSRGRPRLAEARGLGAGQPRDLLAVVRALQPTVLIGTSGEPGTFTEEVVREMARHVERPLVFPLSNPTSQSEAVPADVMRWTDGRALVATGSPFEPVAVGGRTIRIGQAQQRLRLPRASGWARSCRRRAR